MNLAVPIALSHGWDEQAATASWENYADSLLRIIAAKTIKPRQKLSAAELRQRLARWTENTPQVDRRLKELSSPARTLLQVLQLGKRNHWHVSTLLELTSSLLGSSWADPLTPAFSLEGRGGKADALEVVEELFLHGLLVPDLANGKSKLSTFEDWLGQGIVARFQARITPQVLARTGFSFEALPLFEARPVEVTSTVHEADGSEWFLRLAVLWQQLHDVPARVTKQGGFFKRDQERLSTDPLLNQDATDFLIHPILATAVGEEGGKIGHFLVSLGLELGLLKIAETELSAEQMPTSWQQGWFAALADMLGAGSELTSWSIDHGWRGLPGSTSPFSSALLLLLAVLIRSARERWLAISDLCHWITRYHVFWSQIENPPDLTPAVNALLLGWLYPLRILQAAQVNPPLPPLSKGGSEGGWAVRLSPLGRSLLSGELAKASHPEMSKMLLVQPNLEMVAYRQGLSPRIVADLSQIASWTSLGAACTLHLDQASIHRGLERGATFESISGLLQGHAVHAVPSNVLEAIRTWAAKRDRVTVYERVNLLEFLHQADRDAALSRGLVGIPFADRYLLIEDEHALDFRHFRSLGTRDYALPPMVCVAVGEDGVTLTIDPSKADLLVESELQRFSAQQKLSFSSIHTSRGEGVEGGGRVYFVSPESLARARVDGISLKFLEAWFRQRTGQALPSVVRLLWNERNGESAQLHRQIILTLPDETIADGVWQWPETRELLQERLGPRSFIVAPERLDALQRKLEEIAFPIRSQVEIESKLIK